jgi:hypothetical protein
MRLFGFDVTGVDRRRKLAARNYLPPSASYSGICGNINLSIVSLRISDAENRDRKFRDSGGFMMKASRFKYVLVGIAILMGTNAFAANNGSLNLMSPVTVAGTRLAAGNYNVQWEGSGPGVQLNVRKGQKIVASTPAELIPVDHPFDNNEAVIGVEDDGRRELIEIHFSGKKFALEIKPQSAGTSAGRNDTDSW